MTGRREILAFALLMTATQGRAEVPGRVFSVKGAPVAGALVTAYSQETQESRARRLITGQERKPLATSRTAGDGAFRLDTDEAVVAVVVRAEGFVPVATLALQREPLSLRLKEAVMRRGTVTTHGHPVSGAIVIWEASSPYDEPVEFTARTGGDGSYQVPDPDRWATSLVVVNRDFALLTESQGSGKSWGKSPTHELVPGVTLPGQVIDERTGRAVAGLTIWVDDWPQAVSTADGTFTVPHVAADWRRVQARSDALVGTAKPGAGRVVVPVRPARRLSGVVRDASTKAPLAGARVALMDSDEEMTTGSTTTTDARGQYALSPLASGRYMALATRPGYQAGSEGFEAIDLRKVDVRHDLTLAPARRLVGTVVDEQGHPAEGALVTLSWDSMGTFYGRPGQPFEEEGGDTEASVAAADGAFSLSIPESVTQSRARGLRAGVVAFKPGYAAGRAPVPDASSGPITVTLPRGTTVAGRVSAADGTPLADVGIALAEAGPLVNLSARATDDEDDRADWVSSDAEGRFSLQVLPVVHQLLFHKPGFAPQLLEAMDPRDARDLEVVLQRGAQVAGQVVRHDGPAVAGAGLWLSDGVGAVSTTQTEADGRFHFDDLVPGRYELTVRTELGLSATRAILAPDPEVRVEMAPTTTMRGRVVDAVTHLPVPRFDVMVWRASDVASWDHHMAARNQSFAAADGAFVLEDVPLGESTMTVSAEGYRPKKIEDVSVGADVDGDDPVIALDPGLSIRGRVTSADGRVMPEATVSASGDDVEGTETDDDGTYELKGVAAGPVRVEVVKSGFRTARRTIDAHEGARLDVVLSPGLALRGTVVSSAGGGVPGVEVNASSSAADADSQRATTDSAGRFTLRGLSPGRYGVAASASDGSKAALEDVDVATAGPLRLVLERTPTAVLTGTVTGLDEGRGGLSFVVRVMVAGADGPSAGGMADASGAFRVEGAPVGPVTVTGIAMLPGGGTRVSRSNELTLVAGTESATVLEFRDDLLVDGTVTRSGQAVPGAYLSFHHEGMGPSSRTDHEGRYRVALSPGTYRVDVTGAGISYDVEYLAQESGSFDIDVTGATLRGRTREAGTGRPVAEVDVSVWPSGPSGNRPAQELKTNASGVFEMGSLREGRYRVVTAKKGFGQQAREIEVARGDTVEVDFELQSADGVSLKVADARDNRTLEVIVVVRDTAKRIVANRHAGTEADGAVNIPLADGPYLLSVSSSGYGTVTLPITAPARSLQVGLTPGGTLVVESPRKRQGLIRLLQPDGDEYVRCWCNGIAEIRLDGSRTRVEHITPGSYSVELVDELEKVPPRPVVIREGQVSTVTID